MLKQDINTLKASKIPKIRSEIAAQLWYHGTVKTGEINGYETPSEEKTCSCV